MATKHQLFEPGTTLDRFRLEKLLGTGAFGQVWLAMDEGEHGFRKKVALKILTEVTNEHRINALMREARICGVLNHPNVTDVYGVMRNEQAAFIIMEFVEGETLASLWRDLEFLGLRFPRSIVCDIAIAVCEALYHGWTAKDADGKGLHIVHRDLKPANIMISDRGVVKVADFGIAKVADDLTTTRTGKLKGTPSYLAPELWTGSRDFRPAIDLWSVGVLIWEMCTCKRFYGRAGIAEISDLIKSRDPVEEAKELRGYFPEVEPIVVRLLQRDADDRYQSALEVARDLRAVRQGLGPAGDLLQFSRLVRAGRVEPDERHGSLLALPALPVDALDWMPLLQVAESSDSALPWDESVAPESVAKLGPDSERAAGDDGDGDSNVAEATRPGEVTGKSKTSPMPPPSGPAKGSATAATDRAASANNDDDEGGSSAWGETGWETANEGKRPLAERRVKSESDIAATNRKLVAVAIVLGALLAGSLVILVVLATRL